MRRRLAELHSDGSAVMFDELLIPAEADPISMRQSAAAVDREEEEPGIRAKDLRKVLSLSYIILAQEIQVLVLQVLNRGLILSRQRPMELEEGGDQKADY